MDYVNADRVPVPQAHAGREKLLMEEQPKMLE
jgi:hypothetical protein